MSTGPRKNPEESFGALQCCLVEGSPEQQAQQRRIRRRSVTISVLLQVAVLVAVVLVPLFAKTERIVIANVTPVPPYSPYREVTNRQTVRNDTARQNAGRFWEPNRIPPTISLHPAAKTDVSDGPNIPGAIPGGTDTTALIPGTDTRPHPPDQSQQDARTPHTVHVTTIDPAMLRRRVEPVYPTLMKQTHREGRVEIHAIIAEDGTMQSLEVIGGDPMFYHSALEAVQLWLYKPTYLNGKPVQVDTTITVIYSMQH